MALAIGAVVGIAATAGTGLLVRTAADETAASIAATEELTASVDRAPDQLDSHGLMLTARATRDAETALDGAAQVIAAARGKSDSAELEASVAALRDFELLAPERIFELVDLADAQAATVRARVAEFDRIAAEKAAAEKAAAERAAAERAEAERAAAEQAEQSAPDQSGGGSGSPPAPPANPSEAQAIARDLMSAQYGWGPAQFGCLVALWNYESGWNVYASNPSGAYGIPQALPGSKMASAGADWATSARTQIVWGLGYIAGRYSTPCGAWAHVEANGWY
ncbi:lytic transglycosylase domain-containing protein [Agromyces sp. SYSU K20354]|uniref:aggregation-promoting factor C-terminal-like domain-containing protein n=1 Tax=Agromyces cavernae TaxID=2898659 RepID=UPI001E350217|nr:lytic transglycosylase domain-containing protein [Agromyces cavernae]MCD2441881.1 lytic transglycosylase domain-containing protein [Agromyces cavernae]